jgi:hypothetical protein
VGETVATDALRALTGGAGMRREAGAALEDLVVRGTGQAVCNGVRQFEEGGKGASRHASKFEGVNEQAH